MEVERWCDLGPRIRWQMSECLDAVLYVEVTTKIRVKFGLILLMSYIATFSNNYLQLNWWEQALHLVCRLKPYIKHNLSRWHNLNSIILCSVYCEVNVKYGIYCVCLRRIFNSFKCISAYRSKCLMSPIVFKMAVKIAGESVSFPKTPLCIDNLFTNEITG